MARFGRGLICALTAHAPSELGLKRMVLRKPRKLQQPTSPSRVDAAKASPPASAPQTAPAPSRCSPNLSTPGSRASPATSIRSEPSSGGVLQRPAIPKPPSTSPALPVQPAGVLCEILNDDGSMARLPELMKFRAKHDSRSAPLRDLISFRRSREKLIEREEIINLPTDYGDFDLHLYRSLSMARTILRW